MSKLDELISDMHGGDSSLVCEAIESIIGMAKERKKIKKAVPALIKALDDSNQEIVCLAAEALGYVKDKSAVPALLRVWNPSNLNTDDECYPDGYIITALGRIGDRKAVLPLLGALKLKDILIQNFVLITTALGRIGDASVVQDLIYQLNDENQNVRETAFETLAGSNWKGSVSINLKEVEKALKEFVAATEDKQSAKKKAAECYAKIAQLVSKGRKKINMPGELLPDKPKPPKGTFRRRRAHA